MKNYGFVKPEITSDQYVLGAFTSLPKVILQPDGQWDAYLPSYEAQADKYETYGCTVWGTQNALEILIKRHDQGNPNYSERYNYNLVPIRPPGGDPHTVSESIRKNGVVDQEVLPLTDTFDEFCTPTPMTEGYIKRGREFLGKYNYGHEWVINGSVSKEVQVSLMKQALTMSPLGAAVDAWHEEDGIYVKRGEPNHWCVIYGYYESNGQTFFKVFDSYDHSHKILHPNHTISYCKRYSLTPINKKQMGWLESIIYLIKWLWK